jgi:IclR family mhp operon transcriptional activator
MGAGQAILQPPPGSCRMSGSDTLRSLERGLRVLKALQGAPGLSLGALHEATALPKPTLLRILATLERAGMVRRRLADGRYSVVFGQAAALARQEQVALAAAPVLERLCRQVAWPSDLMVPAGDHMVLIESNRPKSPFPIHRENIGHKVNWLLSAVGRAYLAFCSPEERQDILDRVRSAGLAENWLASDLRQFGRILDDVRRRGYATRHPTYGGGPYGGVPDCDGLASIAIPVFREGRVYGAMNLLWRKEAGRVEAMSEQLLPELGLAASKIAVSLE